MSKREVCAYLGKSKRSVENYIRDGRLAVAYVNGKNGQTAVFGRDAVERFRAEYLEAWRTDETFHKARVVPDSPARGLPARATSGDGFAALAAHLAKLSTLYPRPAALGTWVDLDEAAKRSGLPKSYLLAQAKAGVAWAINASTGRRAIWRFRVKSGTLL